METIRKAILSGAFASVQEFAIARFHGGTKGPPWPEVSARRKRAAAGDL